MFHALNHHRSIKWFLPLLLLVTLLLLVMPQSALADDPGLALQFDGVDDHVLLGDTGDLFGSTVWTDQKTVSVWVRADGTAPIALPQAGSLLIGNDRSSTFGISRADYNGLDRIWVWNWDASGLTYVGVPYTPGEWVQITMVHDGVTLSAFRNGTLIASTPSGPTYVPNHSRGDGKLYLGGTARADAPRALAGALDEVRLWDVVLDATTIANWSMLEVTAAHPQWSALRAYYRMTNGAGIVVSDDSQSANDGTLGGGMNDGNWVVSGAFGVTAATATPAATNEVPSPTPTASLATATPTPTSTATSEPPTPTPTATATASLETATPTPTATQAAAGGAGYALAFDGTTDYVALAETSLLMAAGWQNTKTVSLWVKPTASGSCARDSVAHCDAIMGDRPRWWGMSIGPVSGSDKIWVWNYDGNFDVIGIDYAVGEWVHIALVHGDGVLRAFQNGVEVGSVPSGATQQPNTGAYPMLQLGGVIMNSSRNFTFAGVLDEVRIWNLARSEAEIAADMNYELSGSETGLAAYYRMSDGTGSLLTDNSGHGWTGTLHDGGSDVPGDGTLPQWLPSDAFP